MALPPALTERLLISLTICFSSSLALLTGLQNHLNGHPWIEITLVSLTALCCVAFGFSGWILFLLKRITLDAFGLILIGLLPALEATGKLRVGVLRAQAVMRRRSALHNRPSDVRYLRHGKAPDPEKLGGQSCSATTYIRTPASFKNIKETDNYKYSVWHGQVIHFDEKAVLLRDYNDTGDAVRWWKIANQAFQVVQQPSTILVHSRAAATRALECVAEIAMIGDGILMYQKQSLMNYAKHSNSLTMALSATPMSVCNAILAVLGLSKEWGPVNLHRKNAFANNSEKLSRAERYGMLFFILLNESNLFQSVTDKAPRKNLVNAAEVIESFEESADPSSRASVTLQWLSRYQLTKDRLNKGRQVTTQDDQQVGTANREECVPTPNYTMVPIQVELSDQTKACWTEMHGVTTPANVSARSSTLMDSLIASPSETAPDIPRSVPLHHQDIFPKDIYVLVPHSALIAGRSQDNAPGNTAPSLLSAVPSPSVHTSNGSDSDENLPPDNHIEATPAHEAEPEHTIVPMPHQDAEH